MLPNAKHPGNIQPCSPVSRPRLPLLVTLLLVDTHLAEGSRGLQLERGGIDVHGVLAMPPRAAALGTARGRGALVRDLTLGAARPRGQKARTGTLVHDGEDLASKVGKFLVERLDDGVAQEHGTRGPDEVGEHAPRGVDGREVGAVGGLDGGGEVYVEASLVEGIFGSLDCLVWVVRVFDDWRAIDTPGCGLQEGAQALPEEEARVEVHAVDEKVITQIDEVDAIGHGELIFFVEF